MALDIFKSWLHSPTPFHLVIIKKRKKKKRVSELVHCVLPGEYFTIKCI